MEKSKELRKLPHPCLAQTVSKCENFDLFFIKIWFFYTQNTSYLIVRGLKMHFFMPFTPPMFQKYSSIMRAVCAVSEISIHYESSLCYFRYIHLLWEWLGLFQEYIPLWEACAILEITTHHESGLRFFRNIQLSTHYEMSSSKKRN